MILLLRAGNVEIVAQAWSAAANPGGRVNLAAHSGTIGLTMTMDEFWSKLRLHLGNREKFMDLRSDCEAPEETMQRLKDGG